MLASRRSKWYVGRRVGVPHEYEREEMQRRGNKAGGRNMRALWHAAFSILPLFLYSPARRGARARGVRPRMHVSVAARGRSPRRVYIGDGGREKARTRLVDQWDTLPRRIPCDYACDCCSSYDYREIKGGKDKGWTREGGGGRKGGGGKKKAASV